MTQWRPTADGASTPRTPFGPPRELDQAAGESHRDASRAVIVLLVLVHLVPSHQVLPGLGAAGRPAGVFALGLLGLWLAQMVALGRRDSGNQPVAVRWAVFIYLLVVLASYVAAIGRGLPGVEARAMDRHLLTVLGFVGVFLTITDGLRGRRSVQRVIDWLVGLAAVNAVVAIVQFSLRIDLAALIQIPGLVPNREVADVGTRGLDDLARVRGIMRHPIEFGLVMATALPIAVQSALNERSRTRSRRLWTAVVVIGACIPLSISRSATIGLVVGMAVVSFGWSWRLRANALVIGSLAIVGFQAIVPGLLGTIRGLFARLESDSSISARTDDFGATADYIRERPWLGRGPGTFLADRYRVLDNEYLGTIVETGYLGLTALLGVIVAGVLAAAWIVRRTERESAEIARGLGAGLAVALVGFATFDALSFPGYALTLFVVLGCLGALRRVEPPLVVPEEWIAETTPDRR